jgi:hypothetical protein
MFTRLVEMCIGEPHSCNPCICRPCVNHRCWLYVPLQDFRTRGSDKAEQDSAQSSLFGLLLPAQHEVWQAVAGHKQGSTRNRGSVQCLQEPQGTAPTLPCLPCFYLTAVVWYVQVPVMLRLMAAFCCNTCQNMPGMCWFSPQTHAHILMHRRSISASPQGIIIIQAVISAARLCSF